MTLTRRAVLGCGVAMTAVAQKKRPNIVFLFSDDQRKDTVAALGNRHIRTPNLDQLVRSGVSFDNAYCMGGFSAAVCLPSRMMVARGRSWFAVQRMKEATPNLAQTFGDAGYVTYHMGKKGNVDLKANTSFQHNGYVGENDNSERLAGRPGKTMADHVAAFVKQWKSGADREKPLLMYLADGSPHDPRVAPRAYLDKYDPKEIPLPPNYKPFHPFDNGELTIRDEKLAPWPRTEAEVRRHLHEYYAVITYMDEQFGRIFEAFKAAGEFENTVFVFSSDQGIAIGSHGLMGKQNLYQHSMSPALVFAGPGIAKGKRVSGFAYLFDIFPTLCELSGVKAPDGLEGKSQVPVIMGKTKSVRDTVFLAYKDLQRAVRVGDWKLIHYPKVARTQLFDLKNDPAELKDLSADPRQAKRVEELLEVMRREQALYQDKVELAKSTTDGGAIGVEFFAGK